MSPVTWTGRVVGIVLGGLNERQTILSHPQIDPANNSRHHRRRRRRASPNSRQTTCHHDSSSTPSSNFRLNPFQSHLTAARSKQTNWKQPTPCSCSPSTPTPSTRSRSTYRATSPTYASSMPSSLPACRASPTKSAPSPT